MFRFKRAFWMTALPCILGLATQAPAWAQSAQAQQPSADALQAARSACSADLQQFCAGVKPGGGRILACLKEHRDQVSPGCKQAVQAALQGSGGGTGGGAAPASNGPAATSPATAAPAVPAAPAAPVPPAAPASQGSQAAPAAVSSAPAAAKAVAHADSGAPHYFKLKRVKATTKVDDKDMTVYSVLAPEDWPLNGGVVNKPDAGSCFSDMIQVQGFVRTADEAIGMAFVGRSSFRWADDPAVRQQMEKRDQFDAKYKLKDCPIKAPMHAADFLRENFVWKFHKEKPQLVASEPFPELEQLVRAELGLGPKSDGGVRTEGVRIRVSTTNDKGAEVEEWWSGVIVARPIGMAGRGKTYEWHNERVTVFQAPKGQLDGYDKIYKVMAGSMQLDPEFRTWSGNLIGTLYKKRAEEVQKQNQIVADFQRHAAEVIQGVTANQQAGSLQAAAGADQLVRGVQSFRDPSTGRTVELSNLYDHAWSNGNDQYIVTDDPNFNPNGHVNGDWGELQPVRPQP